MKKTKSKKKDDAITNNSMKDAKLNKPINEFASGDNELITNVNTSDINDTAFIGNVIDSSLSPSKISSEKSTDNIDSNSIELSNKKPSNIIYNFFNNYCCCCCKRAAKIHDEVFDPVAQPAKNITHSNRAIRDATNNFEAKFWPKLWKRVIYTNMQQDSALLIQRMYRGYRGRIYFAHQWQLAMSDMNDFWSQMRNKKNLNRELKLIEKLVRDKFAKSIVENTFKREIAKKARLDGARLIQRWWRGFVGRSIFSYYVMLSKALKVRKPKKYPSRLTLETFRRVWARRDYMPLDGWPGRADHVDYDMWEFADHPPKGRDFGLKTKKLVATTSDQQEKEMIMTDHNSWVGIPIAMHPSLTEKQKEQQKIDSLMNSFKKSPYATPVVGHVDMRVLSRPDVKPTLNQTMLSLGWTSAFDASQPLVEEDVKRNEDDLFLSAALSVDPSHKHSRYIESTLRSGSLSPFSRSSVPFNESRSMLSRTNGNGDSGAQPSAPVNTMPVNTMPQRGAVKSVPGVTTSKLKAAIVQELENNGNPIPLVARREEKRLLHLTAKPSSPSKDLRESAWGKLKMEVSKSSGISPALSHSISKGQISSKSVDSKSASELAPKYIPSASQLTLQTGTEMGEGEGKSSSPAKRHADGTLVRDTPWPQKISTHFKFQYTWVPQPLVKAAATDVYISNDATTRKLQKEREENERVEREMRRRKARPPLSLLKEESTVSTLTEMYVHDKAWKMKLRQQRLEAKPLTHPYHWM